MSGGSERELSQADAPQPRTMAKAMALSALANLAAPAAGFAVAPILAQALGAEQRGVVAAATAPLLLMTTLAMFGIPEAITYLVAKNPANARSALKKGLLCLGITATLATVLVLSVAEGLSGGNKPAEELIRLAALFILPTTIISGMRALPRGLHQWKYVNLEKYLVAVFRLALIAAVLMAGLLSPLSTVLILSVAPVVGALAFIRPIKSMRVTSGIAAVSWREMTSFSSIVWLGSVSGIILGRIDQTVMLPLSDARQLGYYAAAASVADAVLVINNAVRDVTFSAQSAGSATSTLQRSARVSLLAGVVMAAALLIPVGWWFPLLFGSDFAHAIPSVSILTVAAVVGIPGSIAGAGLVGRGKPGAVSTSLVIAAVVNIGSLIVLVPALGAVGAALATLAGNLIAANLNIIVLRKTSDVRFLDFYLVNREDIILVSRALGKVLEKLPLGRRFS